MEWLLSKSQVSKTSERRFPSIRSSYITKRYKVSVVKSDSKVRRAAPDTRISENVQVSGTGSNMQNEKGALKMRGLPFRATDDEVVEFFAGYNIIPTSIKYKYDDQGRKSGQACILF
jgi:RNA recognition motif-containing protein